MDVKPGSERVRDYLADHPGSSCAEIASALAMSADTVSCTLRRDVAAGFVDSDVVEGRYRYWMESRPVLGGTSRVVLVAIQKALADGQALTAAEVSKAIDRKAGVTYTALAWLERAGNVVVESNMRPFRYRWTLRDGS